MKLHSKKSGFTLIELTFAIAFISVLLITIALITNEIISLYRKGYAIKTVSQVGRDLIEDFTDSIQNSPPASISAFCDRYATGPRSNCEANDGLYSVYQQFYADVQIKNDSGTYTTQKVPTGGIFCSGKYSYIWNTGYVFGENYKKPTGDPLDDTRLRIFVNGHYFPYTKDPTTGAIDDSRGQNGDFRLVKIEDSARAICAWSIYSEDGTSTRTYPAPNASLTPQMIDASSYRGFKVNYVPSYEPVELLEDSDSALALYDMVIFPPAQVAITNRLFYSGSFILGTINGDINIMTSSNYCQSPDTFNADFSYCAINKFNFSTQASGD